MSELLKINVNDHVEKKNGLSYLSWAWAWAEVLKIDPQAEWWPQYFGPETSQTPYCVLPDGSMMVGVRLTIKGDSKQCLLPVMDHRNKAIKNPDAFAVNTAMMRCLAKCIAMHGLGLYIYAGEDLPEEDRKPDERKPGVIKATDGAEQHVSAERRAELDEMAAYMVECHEAGRDMDAIKMWGDLSANEDKVYLWQQLGPYSKLRAVIKANKAAA